MDLIDITTSGVVIIKKLYVSLIRPTDILEAVALNPSLTQEDLESEVEMLGMHSEFHSIPSLQMILLMSNKEL